MKYMFLLGCSLLVVTPAAAQDGQAGEVSAAAIDDTQPVADVLITVVGSGSRERVDRIGQSVSVIGARELEGVQGPDLTRVLERLPGVSFSRNGGLGGQTGLNVRGANADQLLVLVDGVRIADYASPGGGYDLGNLLGGNLSKLELLRGSNSVVWGSQAIGGVLSVTTEELDGLRAAAEYGAYDTVQLSGGAGIAGDGHAFSVTGGYARTDGFSAKNSGTEADGYRQWNAGGKVRIDLTEGLSLRATGRYADSHLAIDQLGPDALDFQDTREVSARTGLDYQGNGFSLSAGLALADVRRDYDTGFGASTFTGRSWRAELKGRTELAQDIALDFGADNDWTRSTSSFDPDAKARQSSGHALLSYTGQGVVLAAGARLDDHDRFGSHWTFGANGAVPLGDGWRLRGSFGEGFKAPTLYQLFGGFVGNPALQPETSRSFEAGIEKGNRNAGLHAAATLFRRNSRNLIDLDSSFVYQNVARARAQGFELELGAVITDTLRAQAAYTYLKARDLTQARDLARRPRHALSVSADWTTPLAGLKLGADLRLQGDSVEYSFSGTPRVLDGFAVATLRASLPIGEKVELYGRIENLTDARYETAGSFSTAGRSAYGGVRVRW